MWKKWRGSQQVPTLHGISHEQYSMHATQLFLTGQVHPMLMSRVPHEWGTLDRKSTLFKSIVKIFLKGVVFMFWHDIVCIELFYCVTNFELVRTWNKVAVVENAKKCRLYPTFPYCYHLPLSHTVPPIVHIQRRIFIFGALGYFKLGALLEGLRRLMSYKISTTRARYIHWTICSNS